MNYRADIDGLRAIAILAVLLYHCELGCPGGYTGVDVFFVVSGFLIGKIVLNKVHQGTFRFTDFWARRFRRLMPAAFVMVGAAACAGYFILSPDDYAEFGQSVCANSLFSSNLFFWKKCGYFGGAGQSKPLLHTWSLAVEEQFYLFLPPLCLFMRRFRADFLLVLLTVLSFALCCYTTPKHASVAFYWLPTRAWELLAGVLLAKYAAENGRASNLRGFLGAFMILFGMWACREDNLFPGPFALLPCLGTVLVLSSSSQAELSYVGRVLSCKPLVSIGLMSYSLYLWHWPLLVFANYWSLKPWAANTRVLWFVFLLSFVFAAVSYRLVEYPMRFRFQKNASHRAVILAAVASLAFSLTLGWALYRLDGLPRRYSASMLRIFAASGDNSYACEVPVSAAVSGTFPHIGAEGNKVSFVLWGDSHAMAVATGVAEAARSLNLTGVQATHSATPPFLDLPGSLNAGLKQEAIPFNAGVFKFVQRERPTGVILVAHWSAYPENEIRQGLQHTLSQLEPLNVKVAIMAPVPHLEADPAKTLISLIRSGKPAALSISREQHRTASALYVRILQGLAYPNVTVLDPAPYLAGSDGNYLVGNEEELLYRDPHHLSTAGSMRLKSMFSEWLKSVIH